MSITKRTTRPIHNFLAQNQELPLSRFPKYTIDDSESTWKPTPPAYMDAIEPHWKTIRTFLIDSSSQFKPAPPPLFSTNKTSVFYKDAEHVYNVAKSLTPEQEAIARGWARQIARNVGPVQDVPAPDVMTTGQHMVWMLDEYEKITGKKAPGMITGKPLGLGGSLGRTEATGRGVMITALAAMDKMKLNPYKSTAAIQGFGTELKCFLPCRAFRKSAG